MKKMGIDPLDVLDDLVSNMLEMMKNGIKLKFPNISEKDLNIKMREQMEIYDKKNR